MNVTEGNSVLYSISSQNTFQQMPNFIVPPEYQAWYEQKAHSYSAYDLMAGQYVTKMGLPSTINEPIHWYPAAMEIVTTLPVVLEYANDHKLSMWEGDYGLMLRPMHPSELLTHCVALERVYANDITDPNLGCRLYPYEGVDLKSYSPDANWRLQYLELIERVSVAISQNDDPTKYNEELVSVDVNIKTEELPVVQPKSTVVDKTPTTTESLGRIVV